MKKRIIRTKKDILHSYETGGCMAKLKPDGTCENPQCRWPELPRQPPPDPDDVPF